MMKTAVAIGIGLVASLYIMNASWRAPAPDGPRSFLAHRGVHQLYDRENLGPHDCTATRMFPPIHSFLENTLPSIEAALAHGADAIEIDIHPTRDGAFIVFHDYTVDCRTEGTGRTQDKTVAELKALDIGYGYTADGGESFPFRGEGVGLAPTLAEVLKSFPDTPFLLNLKGDTLDHADRLIAYLNGLDGVDASNLSVYGGSNALMARIESLEPQIRTFTTYSIKTCAKAYAMWGWSGRMPALCRDTTMVIPVNFAPYLWGWPNLFQKRMAEAGTKVYITGPRRKNFAIGGLNSVEDYESLPASYKGGIWTDQIERLPVKD
ncbi:MAG: glycerophosphodiester phosphodiesterase family protein [Pseudomonadota bacterium]